MQFIEFVKHKEYVVTSAFKNSHICHRVWKLLQFYHVITELTMSGNKQTNGGIGAIAKGTSLT